MFLDVRDAVTDAVGAVDWRWVAGPVIAAGTVIFGGLQWWVGHVSRKESRSAAVVNRYYSDGHGVQLTSNRQLPELGAFGVTVFNEGPAIARRVRVTATFAGGQLRGSGMRWTIEPNDEVTFEIDLAPAAFLTGGDTPVVLAIDWDDGNGSHRTPVALRMTGTWPTEPKLVRDSE